MSSHRSKTPNSSPPVVSSSSAVDLTEEVKTGLPTLARAASIYHPSVGLTPSHTATCRCVLCLDKRLPGPKPGSVSVSRSSTPHPIVTESDYQEAESHWDLCHFFNNSTTDLSHYQCICEELEEYLNALVSSEDADESVC